MNSIVVRFTGLFLLVLVFAILPLPLAWDGIRPPTYLLFIIYLDYYWPERANLSFVFVVGILLDVLSASVIGQHPFSLIVTLSIAGLYARRFLFISMAQQMAFIGLLCFLNELTLMITNAFLGYHYSLFTLIMNACLGLLCWPWMRYMGDNYLLKNQINEDYRRI
jgi:rod shape-determining protein MreD